RRAPQLPPQSLPNKRGRQSVILVRYKKGGAIKRASLFSVRGIYSKSRSFNGNIATSSDRQVPFGGLRHCCKQHLRRTLRRFFSKSASLLHWRPYKSSTLRI